RDLRENRVAGEVADPVVDLLEAGYVHDHDREAPLIPLRTVDLTRQRLVEEAAVVKARQRVEVGELASLPKPARIFDHRRDALRELFEPAQVFVIEIHAVLAREHAEPADPAAGADEWDSERPMHCSRSVRLCVERGQLERPRLPAFRRSSADTGGSVPLVVPADRAAAAFAAL